MDYMEDITQKEIEFIDDAIQALKNDEPKLAREILKHVLQTNPSNDTAWLYLALTTTKKQEYLYCLNKALALNPKNMKARQLKRRIELISSSDQDRSIAKQQDLSVSLTTQEASEETRKKLSSGTDDQEGCKSSENSAHEADTMEKCPYCAEAIKAEAKVCRYCGSDLRSETKHVAQDTDMEDQPQVGLITADWSLVVMSFIPLGQFLNIAISIAILIMALILVDSDNRVDKTHGQIITTLWVVTFIISLLAGWL